MDIWHRLIFPVRRLCHLALSNHRKNAYGGGGGAGLVKLRDDVETCEYEDVQVMWEMLHKTTDHQTQVIERDNHHRKRKQLPFWFWRVFVCSNP